MKLGTRRVSALGLSFAVHVAAAIVVIWLTPAPVLLRVDRSIPPIAFIRSAQRFDDRAALQQAGGTPGDLGIQVDESAAGLGAPGFPFELGKIVRRAGVLFPFVTGSRSFERLVIQPGAPGRFSLKNLFGLVGGETAKPPLILSDSAVQSLLDRSWSRRNRWHAFQIVAAAADVYDPETGSLPTLLRGYVVQNGLQPYEERRIRDPRLWVQLGLAADHIDFLDFASQYASRHSSSKATTELLFLIDNLAQASLDALITLVTIEPETQLAWTRETNRQAFDAIVAIREHYLTELDRRGLGSPRAIGFHYDDVRLAILAGMLRATPDGYRADDARFRIGEIYWEQGRAEHATEVWREARGDPDGVYSTATSQLRAAVGERDGREPNPREIRRILQGERQRWITLSLERLRQFGYRVDTF